MTATAGWEGGFELEDGVRVIIRAMTPVSRATDYFLDDLLSRGSSQRTVDTYRRLLDKFAEHLKDPDLDVGQVTEDQCRTWLATFSGKAPGTRAHAYSVLSSFFKWLYRTKKIKRNPLEWIARPKRVASKDLDVVTVSKADVLRLLDAADGWTEKLALMIPLYTGARRRAVAQIRLRDYDQTKKRLRFHEKGNKVSWRPVPWKLSRTIEAAIAAGVYSGPDDYLVPAEGGLSRTGVRDDRVIWRAVHQLGQSVGVKVHVHSLRAAFAVFYLEKNPGDIEGLKEHLGHESIATTQIYLRKLDRETAMDRVRDLDWDEDVERAQKVLDGRGVIRTHSARGTGFTARPGSPTPAHAPED